MKILLQQKTTGFYLQPSGVWTRDVHTALDFRTSQNALKHLHAECLTDAQVVAVFVTGRCVDSISFPTHVTNRGRAGV